MERLEVKQRRPEGARRKPDIGSRRAIGRGGAGSCNVSSGIDRPGPKKGLCRLAVSGALFGMGSNPPDLGFQQRDAIGKFFLRIAV